METYQIALVIVLIGCVAGLFYIYFKNRQSAEGGTEEPEEGVNAAQEPFSIPDPPPFIPETEEVVPSDQHTIYAFEREAQVYVCPRCDGENSVSRHICCICGFEFRKGVW